MMGLDMVTGDAVTVAACAPGAGHPECGSHPDNEALFKPATKRGGARVGAGRPPSVAVLAPGWDGPRWYCVEVQSRQELAVAEALMALGFDAVAPQFMDLVLANLPRGKPAREVLRPAFPGYVIAEFDAADAGWRRIASQPGVKRVMGCTPERPTPLPAVHVAWIIGQFGAEGAQRRSRLKAAAPIGVGCWVRVVAGPAEGVRGRVVISNGRAVVLAVAGHRVKMAQAAVEVCA